MIDDLTVEQLLLLAEDPSTPSATLTTLAAYPDANVQHAVALNPNTPLPTLVVLARTYTDAFCRNPALPLFLVEDPNFVNNLPWALVHLLAESKALPKFLLRALAKSPYEKIQEKLASSPRLPNDLLDNFLLCPNRNIRLNAAKNPGAPRSFLKLLYHAGSSPHLQRLATPKPLEESVLRELSQRGFWAKVVVAHHPQCPTDLLFQFVQHPEAELRRTVAEREDAPQEILIAALEDKDEQVVIAAAKNPALPTQYLEKLVEKKLPYIWPILLNRGDTPPHLLSQLLDNAPDLRTTTKRLLDQLTEHPDKDIRVLVASHEETPQHCLEQLSKDGSPRVRQAVLKNPNVPEYLVSTMLRDPDGYVQREAAKVREARGLFLKRSNSKARKPKRDRPPKGR